MFVVIELQFNSDSTVGNFVWSFDNENSALEKYYSVLAAAANSAVYIHGAIMVNNDWVRESKFFKHESQE